jgi:hypothetical protein
MAVIAAAALCMAACGAAEGGPTGQTQPETVATPTASRAAGAVVSGATVALVTATSGAAIYYTTDGETPTTDSTLYSAAIDITGDVTIKAYAVKAGMYNSGVLTVAYTVAAEQVVTPTATPAEGEVASGATVALATTTPGAEIYYTTDGSTPDRNNGNSTLYFTPIEITVGVTIKAYAVKADMADSEVLTAAYTVAGPLFGTTWTGRGNPYVSGQNRPATGTLIFTTGTEFTLSVVCDDSTSSPGLTGTYTLTENTISFTISGSPTPVTADITADYFCFADFFLSVTPTDSIAGMWSPNGESMFLIFNAVNKTVTTLYGLLFGTYSLAGSGALTITLNPDAVTGDTSISGTASIVDGNLTLAGFPNTSLTMTLAGIGSEAFSASYLNTTYSPGSRLFLNADHPVIALDPDNPSDDFDNFTVWVRDGTGGGEWNGDEINLDTFGTWVYSPPDSYYTLDNSIVAATPGQPSQYGYGGLAPLVWHGNPASRNGTHTYDVFIVTEEGATTFKGRYKNNVAFTNGVAAVTIDAGWTGWSAEATVSDSP